MTDDQFVARLVELDAEGPAGIPAMREVLRGQMSRLIALAARGLKAKAVKEKAEDRKRQIPDEFPDQSAKDAALEYWNGHRRPDLVARAEEIAEAFHTHHHIRNVRFTRWDMAWKTWYVRAVSIERPPQGAGLFSAPIVFEQASIEGWVSRLEIFGGIDGPQKGSWTPKWGPTPLEPGNKVPEASRSIFAARHPSQRAQEGR